MKKLIMIAALASSTPALAQEAPGELEVSGSAALVSDYRFRGVSQTDKEMAVQAGFSVNHESGLYAGVWGSNLAGWGTFGGSNMELDIYGGYAVEIDGIKVDAGLTWYMYPGGSDTTDFAEPYIKVSGTVGPASLLAGIAYAPKQEALGNWYNTPQSRVGSKHDNLYIWADASAGIPGTPLTFKAHLGHSDGNPGLGPNGTSIAPTGKYWDWSLGGEAAVGPLTLGISYVDTNISRADSAYLGSGFATSNGASIADGTVVFSLSAGF